MLDVPSTFDTALPLISGVVAADGTLTDTWPARTAFGPLPRVVVTCWHCVRSAERSYAVLWPSVGGEIDVGPPKARSGRRDAC